MAEHPWGWTGGNPYRRTPFQVLDLEVDVRGRAAINHQVNTRRNRVRNAPDRYRLFGEPITEARVNEAEAAVRDPAGRLYAELCTHRPRRSRLDLTALTDRLAALGPLDVRVPVTLDPAGLARAVPPLPERPRAGADPEGAA